MKEKTIELSQTLTITPLSGKTIPLTLAGKAHYYATSISTVLALNVAGVWCSLKLVDTKPCLVFEVMKEAEINPLKSLFPALQAKNRNVFPLSKETESSITQAQKALIAEHIAAKAELARLMVARQETDHTTLKRD